jgi:hypothetical protein
MTLAVISPPLVGMGITVEEEEDQRSSLAVALSTCLVALKA